MFSKRSSYVEKTRKEEPVKKEPEKSGPPREVPVMRPAPATDPSVNKILKGSKLLGDINVTCDLEVSGDVDGNITSLKDSNIFIKGVCKGNIETREGSVNIEGELNGGNITAGKDVKVLGKFNGGEVKAAGKIFIDGEFNGRLEGNDVEIGPNSNGKGEIFYKEFISIAKGAKVEVQVSQAKQALKEVKATSKEKVPEQKPVQQKIEAGE